MFKDITLGTIWIGEVIKTDDPLKLGRVKVKVFGKFDELDDEVIPWAIPYNQLVGGNISLPKVKDIVNVMFENGDENVPFWTSATKINEGVEGEIADDYPKVWSIVYDNKLGEDGEGNEGEERKLQIYYTETQGLVIKKNDSTIQIRNEDESIFIQNGSTEDVIHINDDGISLGSEGKSDEPAVLGDKNVAALEALSEQIDAVDTRITNLINNSLTPFFTAQGTAAGILPFTALLVPGYTALWTSLAPLTIAADSTKIKAKLKAIGVKEIPDTRSDKVTLDGPSKKG